MRVKLHVSLRKWTFETEVKLFAFLAFFINLLLNSIIYCYTMLLNRLLTVYLF